MRPKKLFFLLVTGYFAFTLPGCQQSNHQHHYTPVTTTQVDQLINKGEDLESGNIDSLLDIIKKLHAIADTTTYKTAWVYKKIFQAHYLWMRSDHKAAMAIAVDALSDAEKWKINRAIPELYGMMANLYKENTDYKMAFAAADKGLNAAVTNKDTAEIISALGLKAMFIHSLWLNQHLTDKSLDLQLQALKMAEANPKYEIMRIRFYDNIAQYYKDNKDFNNAIAYGNRSVPLAYKYKQFRSLTYAYSWLGEAWYQKGNHTKGLMYLDSALQIARKIKEPYRQMEIYYSLADCAMLSGNYKEVIEYNAIARNMHDSLQVQLNTKQIGELQIKYETAKKDKEIVLLDKSAKIRNREIIYILSGSLIFIAFFILLLLQSRIIHRHNNIIKAKNDALNSALNNIAYIQSHELRKPVASILGLMNIIKHDGYHADKDTLRQLEAAAEELDEKIKDINSHTEI